MTEGLESPSLGHRDQPLYQQFFSSYDYEL